MALATKVEIREFDDRFEVGYVEPTDDGWRGLMVVWKKGRLSPPHIQVPSIKFSNSKDVEILADSCYVAAELLSGILSGQVSDD